MKPAETTFITLLVSGNLLQSRSTENESSPSLKDRDDL